MRHLIFLFSLIWGISAFACFDKNQDGKITEVELNRFITGLEKLSVLQGGAVKNVRIESCYEEHKLELDFSQVQVLLDEIYFGFIFDFNLRSHGKKAYNRIIADHFINNIASIEPHEAKDMIELLKDISIKNEMIERYFDFHKVDLLID